jgi:ADP-heptose:LPS heptosyltransferase
MHHPLMDAALARKAVFMGMNRHNFLHGMSGIAYGGDVFPVATDTAALEKFGLTGKRYVTIHNGFDLKQERLVGKGKRATKCYPHFNEVVAGLRHRFPGLCVVQLGATTSAPVAGVDLALLGRAALPETAEILRNSALHIDNESGLVHLAACLGVKSCVIFGPTDPDFFSYEGNINLRPPFCDGCWWVTDDWMVTCPRGFGEARCMSEQRPETVIEAIASHLMRGTGKTGVALRPWPTLILGNPPRYRLP